MRMVKQSILLNFTTKWNIVSLFKILNTKLPQQEENGYKRQGALMDRWECQYMFVFQDLGGCKACVPGYYCPGTANVQPTACGLGKYSVSNVK